MEPIGWTRWAPEGVLTWAALACQLIWQEQRRQATRTARWTPVVDQRALSAAVARWYQWQCIAEWKKGQGPQRRNGCALIMVHLFVYMHLVLTLLISF